MELIVREATLADVNNLAVLKQQVYISTLAINGLIEEFSTYILSEYSVKNVGESLKDVNILTLLALYNNALIGCVDILLNQQCPILNIEPSIKISNFYILERFQSIGIGQKLLGKCMEVIKQMNYKKVWLPVYYRNQQAIDFYKRNNFIHIGEMDFVLGGNKYKNYIMIRDI